MSVAHGIPLPPVGLPEHLARVAMEYAEGTRTPAEPRNAATVVLLPLVVGMERILAAAVNAVRRLRRLLTGRHVGSAWVEVLWVSDGRRMPAPVVWHASARGPPAGATPG